MALKRNQSEYNELNLADLGNAVMKRKLCNNDVYTVTRSRNKYGRFRYYSTITDAHGKKRVCCQGTPFKWVATHTYFVDANDAAQDALNGNNPWVSMEHAQDYLSRGHAKGPM